MGLGDIGEYLDENWYGGEIEGDFFSRPKEDDLGDLMEDAPVSGRSSEKVVGGWDWQRTMSTALMSGRHTADILSQYGDALEKFNCRAEAEDFLKANDGWLGYFVVDVSCLTPKFTYEDIPAAMRACNLFAVNSSSLREVVSRSLVSDAGATMDGYLSTEDGVSEEVCYVDEVTGLPCMDAGTCDTAQLSRRISEVAELLRGKRILTQSEYESIGGLDFDGTMELFSKAMARSFSPKSDATGAFQDDAVDFGLEEQTIDFAPDAENTPVEVSGLGEGKIDDIGGYYGDGEIDVSNDREFAADDLGMLDDFLDDSPIEIEDEHDPSEMEDDIPVQNGQGEFVIDTAVDPLDEIAVDSSVLPLDEVGRDLYQLDPSDYEDDIKFDSGDSMDFIDLDDLQNEYADSNEVRVETPVQPYAIENDFEWVI